MPKIKEVQFFNSDFGNRKIRSIEEYEQIFSGSNLGHLAVGEATARYLYSRAAIPAIMRYAHEPRIIVMIRDPVSMAPSLHEQTFVNGDEDEPNFENAWRLQKQREHGIKIPIGCRDPELLQYGRLCMLGEQLERMFSIVPREKVLVLNIEDVKADPRKIYLDTLGFLGLPDDGRTDFPAINTAKRRLFPRSWRYLRRANLAMVEAGMPQFRIASRVLGLIERKTRREHKRAPVSFLLRQELRDYFSCDVRRLEDVTGLDLKHWR